MKPQFMQSVARTLLHAVAAAVLRLRAARRPRPDARAIPVSGRRAARSRYTQGAKANSLDQHVSNTVSTRNIALNIFESLMTRDASNMAPMPELAESVAAAPDGHDLHLQAAPWT